MLVILQRNNKYKTRTSFPENQNNWRKVTLTISAFPAPQDTNMAFLQFCITGKVRVILCGGGFGESLIGATQSFFS